MKIVDAITGWRFMDEPLWRWFVFIIALAFMLWAWRAILDFMR